MRVFVAGASGVIGRQLLPMLVAAGHEVTGMTRSWRGAEAVMAAGALVAIADVYDRRALAEWLLRTAPEVVVHQMTDLSVPTADDLGPERLRANARIREEGTANLVDASAAVGVRRIVAQSIGWLYAPGREPHREEDPLQLVEDGGGVNVTRRGTYELERTVLTDPRFEGVVLRYGRLYGEGTWSMTPPEPPTVHVTAAARAATLAVDRGAPGAYNIADPGPLDTTRAREQLGWDPTA